MRSFALFGLLAAALSLVPAQAADWSDDFSGALDDWLVPLPADWRLLEESGNQFLRLAVGMPIGEPRRPVKFAVYQPACVSDFELTTRVRRREVSMIVVFGYQNRSRFYYTHLSADDGNHSVHNGLFKVHGGSRYRIAGLGSAPTLPTDDWHMVRILRQGDRMAVFVDGQQEPSFEARDPRFRFGRIGLGSFDHTGDFDDFQLSGTLSDQCADDDLSPLDQP